jgi:tRNA threonylcarbamoyl adenosine modification protein (Sua5/YciO/YrdC/YwlC family)
METELTIIHPENPQERQLQKVVDCLKSGGLVIYPTDTVYGLGCDIFKTRSVEKIAQLKGLKPDKANFSIICQDLSHLSDFARPVSTPIYKLMRRTLPGPFTFIVAANNKVPNLFVRKKTTVGIRVPNNKIILELVRLLGNPIVSTSVHDEDLLIDYTTDPELIFERYKGKVDMVVAGGPGGIVPSTVIDCTGEEPIIIRKGLGEIDL